MHELSIALSILELANEEASQRGVRVHSIHLRLGPLSGVVKEALLFAYEVAREGDLLADASLVVEDMPILAHCPTCQDTMAVVSAQQLCCAQCGTPTPEIVSGREMEIFAMEVE